MSLSIHMLSIEIDTKGLAQQHQIVISCKSNETEFSFLYSN